MKELTRNQQARLIGRKLQVTRAPKIHAPKTDYDRRDAKEDIHSQLDGLEADDWAMHWDATDERKRGKNYTTILLNRLKSRRGI